MEVTKGTKKGKKGKPEYPRYNQSHEEIFERSTKSTGTGVVARQRAFLTSCRKQKKTNEPHKRLQAFGTGKTPKSDHLKKQLKWWGASRMRAERVANASTIPPGAKRTGMSCQGRGKKNPEKSVL